MAVEHRCSKRNSTRRSVVLDSPGRGLTSADSGDISLGGMFVQTDGLEFPLDTPVFVAFDREHFGVEAMVVHRSPSGIGLMFLEMETRIRRALEATLCVTPTLASA